MKINENAITKKQIRAKFGKYLAGYCGRRRGFYTRSGGFISLSTFNNRFC